MDRVELAKALRKAALQGIGDLMTWDETSQGVKDGFLREADRAIELLPPDNDLKVHRLNLEELVLEMGVVPSDEDTLGDLLEHIRHAFVGLRLGKTEWANKWSAESHKARVWRDAYKMALEIAKTIGELDQ